MPSVTIPPSVTPPTPVIQKIIVPPHLPSTTPHAPQVSSSSIDPIPPLIDDPIEVTGFADNNVDEDELPVLHEALENGRAPKRLRSDAPETAGIRARGVFNRAVQGVKDPPTRGAIVSVYEDWYAKTTRKSRDSLWQTLKRMYHPWFGNESDPLP